MSLGEILILTSIVSIVCSVLSVIVVNRVFRLHRQVQELDFLMTEVLSRLDRFDSRILKGSPERPAND